MTAFYIVGGVILFFAVLYIIAIMPGRRRPATAIFAAHSYAHRGIHENGVPENSMTAFRKAVELGYGIECDVQLTKDGIPVVFHDGTLHRMCGENAEGGCVDYTYEELCGFRLGGTDEKIPTFDEFLAFVDGRVPLLIEIKNDGDGIATARVAAEHLIGYRGIYCIESFNPLIVAWFRKNRPQTVRGCLYCQFHKHPTLRKPLYMLIGTMIFNITARPDFIAFDYRDAKGFLPLWLCKRSGAYTFAWTVKDENAAASARKCGFDSLIFENIRPEQ